MFPLSFINGGLGEKPTASTSSYSLSLRGGDMQQEVPHDSLKTEPDFLHSALVQEVTKHRYSNAKVFCETTEKYI